MQVVRATQETQTKESILRQAFESFNEASARLEDKYLQLHRESESLRVQLAERDLAVKRAEKLAHLGEMAAALAHEVRNPLGAIKLFLSLLRQDLKERTDSLTIVNEIDQSIESLDTVVSNILFFSRDRKPDFSPINLNAVISEIVEGLKKGQGARATIGLELGANPFVLGCEHSLRRAFQNLLQNALQATRFVGKITIRTLDSTQGLMIEISDNGPGIKTELMDKIFEPFVSSKNEGTGLGLAIVRQIVEQHAGTISVENRDGAVFKIALPRKQRP